MEKTDTGWRELERGKERERKPDLKMEWVTMSIY